MDPHLDTIDFRENASNRMEGAPSAVPLGEGFRLGKYLLAGALQRGGMGIVYKAVDLTTLRFVAMKIVGRKQDQSAEGDRFDREAEVLARLQRLNHPHIVPVYEIGAEGEFHFVSMKLLEGGNLHQATAAFRERPQKAAGLLLHIADAVASAHDQGILHLDLKPANILLDLEGKPYVSDFGVAGTWDPHTGRTVALTLVGTPAYMAPEQLTGEGRDLGPATDVHGLGGILYELLTGRPPFDIPSRMTLDALRDRTLTAPRKLNPRIPGDLEIIINKCLEKDPRRRYANVRDLQQDLRRFLASEPVVASPLGHLWRRLVRLWQRLPRPSVRPADEALRLLTPILQNVSDGALVVDSAGMITLANAAATRILAEDLTGHRLEDWLRNVQWGRADHQEQMLAAAEFPLVRAQHGETVAETDVLLHTNSRPAGVWLRLTAHPWAPAGARDDPATEGSALAVFRDVSDLKPQPDEETQHKSLWDSLRLNVFRKNLDGRYTFVNSVFCSTVGKPRAQVLGRSDFDFFRADDAEIYRRSETKVIESGQVVERIEEHHTNACAGLPLPVA